MSAVTERIAEYWIGKGVSSFLTPATWFTEEDKPLIEAGVFKLSTEELQYIQCPFGCGQREQIYVLSNDSETGVGHYVICSDTGEQKELDPREYQLYAFDPLAMLKFGKLVKPEKPTQRHKTFPRGTNWIKVERDAVRDFANDPKRNKDGKEPHELCNHVWNLNRDEFEKAATLPAKQRGYKNAASLRAYFYKCRHRYARSKYAALQA